MFIMYLLVVVLGSCQQQGTQSMKVIILTKTDGYRHNCISTAVKTLEKIGMNNNIKIEHTEDSLYFTPSQLESVDVIVFLQTIGNILGESQQLAIEDFVMNGGGLVTIHTGTVTENEWHWFVDVVGGKFIGHPPTQRGRLIIEDLNHPATSFFSDTIWEIDDEWYSFDRNPRNYAHVLISIDESSYDVDDNQWFAGVNQRMGDHPIVWYKEAGKGRVFQTALGHEANLYQDTLFIQHLTGAILWAGKRE
jgi:uncharacterized protein